MIEPKTWKHANKIAAKGGKPTVYVEEAFSAYSTVDGHCKCIYGVEQETLV